MSGDGLRVPGERLVADPDVPGAVDVDGPVIGVLALQGDVREHLRLLRRTGARPLAVTRPEQLAGLDGVVLPGGESTTIGRLAAMYGLLEPLRQRIAAGLPAFGTCAGAILLGRRARFHDGRPSDQPLLGVLDSVARRNAFGRQVASFEADVTVAGVPGGPMRAVFIRAPWFDQHGDDVEVLARVHTPLGDKVVIVRQGHVLASAFHPELTDDARLHALFVELVERRRRALGDAVAAAEQQR